MITKREFNERLVIFNCGIYIGNSSSETSRPCLGTFGLKYALQRTALLLPLNLRSLLTKYPRTNAHRRTESALNEPEIIFVPLTQLSVAHKQGKSATSSLLIQSLSIPICSSSETPNDCSIVLSALLTPNVVQSSSSGRYRLLIASLIWLFAPLGSRSIAQEKFIWAKWFCPNFLYTCQQQIKIMNYLRFCLAKKTVK